VFDFDPVHVRKKNARIRPFDPKTGFKHASKGSSPHQLHVDEWQLMHAAAKSELSRSFSLHDARSHALSLWGRMRPYFVWNKSNLRLVSADIFRRKDSSYTFDSSRLGEGIGHLYMQAHQYTYWDHLPSLYERVAGKQIEHSQRLRVAKLRLGPRPEIQPDFVFEDDAKNVALAEMKGSFVEFADEYTPITGTLRDGLHQLDAWKALVIPTPSKAFAMAAFLRRENDPRPEPSLLGLQWSQLVPMILFSCPLRGPALDSPGSWLVP